MEIRKAQPTDIEQIMEIIWQAQVFMKESGINQWQDGYPSKALIEQDITRQESFILEDAGELVGTFMVTLSGEPDYNNIYEGAWHTSGEYAAVHRIASGGTTRRKGLASAMLAYVEELCRIRGIEAIRLDTHEDNIAMQSMVKKNGFNYCGIIYLSGGEKRLAYDKCVNPLECFE